MSTPDQLLQSLQHFGVRYKEYAGWRTRNRGALEAHVVVVHDSVTGSMSDERAATFCRDGRSDLAGPLYECLVGRDGMAHLIGWGKSNNAGSGNKARFMQAWGGKMPLDHELARPGGIDYTAANSYAHAVAYTTYGAGPYTPQQLEAGPRIIAAYCRAEGWGAYGAPSIIGHGEYSSRKVDPELNMGGLRSTVDSLLKGSGTPNTAEVWHVVIAGQTLWGLSRQYGVPVQQIKLLNNLSGDIIGVGWRLRIK